MVGGLGTPTHGAVVDFLNEEGVPDLFVSSGSLQWGDDPEQAARGPSAGSPTTRSRARSSASTSRRTCPTPRSASSSRTTTSARTARRALRQYLDDQIVEVAGYTPGNTDVAPQIAALQASRGRPRPRLQHAVATPR